MRGRYTIKLRQNHGFIGGFKPFTTVTVTVGHMPNLLEMEVFFMINSVAMYQESG